MSETARVAIFGTSYIKDEYDAWVVRQWQHVTRKLNPEAHIYLVDSDSPYGFHFGCRVIRLADNIGHLSRGGQDGWGRAFVTGLELLAPRYDWVVHIESDLIMVRPVLESMIEPTEAAGKLIGAPLVDQYGGFIETGLMAMKSEFVSKSGIIPKYDWQNTINRQYPENRILEIARPYLCQLFLKGGRAEGENVSAQGFDYLTHAKIADIRSMIISAGLTCI